MALAFYEHASIETMKRLTLALALGYTAVLSAFFVYMLLSR